MIFIQICFMCFTACFHVATFALVYFCDVVRCLHAMNKIIAATSKMKNWPMIKSKNKGKMNKELPSLLIFSHESHDLASLYWAFPGYFKTSIQLNLIENPYRSLIWTLFSFTLLLCSLSQTVAFYTWFTLSCSLFLRGVYLVL